MKRYCLTGVFAILSLISNGGTPFPEQQTLKTDQEIFLTTKTGIIYGTLSVPDSKNAIPVVLIIAGSGPTDRDGNNPMMKNNSLKMLSEGLLTTGIASVRYDKRGVGKSHDAASKEEDLRFDTYVKDAIDWINLLRTDKRFSKIIVIGHSEGSLIGMIAAKSALADGFISIAGAGQSADKILKEQLKIQPQMVIDMTYPIIDSLVAGKTVTNVNPMLNSLFRASIQPYLISWFRYDPQDQIRILTFPVLIIQGKHDIQVSTQDAELLASANKNARLILIDRMNHILKESEADRQLNIATYTNAELPVVPQLITECLQFVRNVR
jgi:uncharacterized protein